MCYLAHHYSTTTSRLSLRAEGGLQSWSLFLVRPTSDQLTP